METQCVMKTTKTIHKKNTHQLSTVHKPFVKRHYATMPCRMYWISIKLLSLQGSFAFLELGKSRKRSRINLSLKAFMHTLQTYQANPVISKNKLTKLRNPTKNNMNNHENHLSPVKALQTTLFSTLRLQRSWEAPAAFGSSDSKTRRIETCGDSEV